MRPQSLAFLKLGGSLITDKDKPHTSRPETLRRLAEEIAAAWADRPELRLVLGHGSGSFGHVPARQYATRQGVKTPEAWGGFVEVWREASDLNRLVMDALREAGLPALAFPPSAAVTARAGRAAAWDLEPLQSSLRAGLIPVVYGDVVFDRTRGGTILSTEDLFVHLAGELRPDRILIAGREPGVWADFPACTRILGEITPHEAGPLLAGVGGSAATDVTGGMASKVELSLSLVRESTDLQVWIFSGQAPGAVRDALLGRPSGTCIHAG